MAATAITGAKMLSSGQGSKIVNWTTQAFSGTNTTMNVPITDGMHTILHISFHHAGSERCYGPSALGTAGKCGLNSDGTVTITRSAGTTSGLAVNMRIEGY